MSEVLQRILVSDTPAHVGQSVKLKGWVDSQRDHGKVSFIDLRDESGKIQCVATANQFKGLSSESVVEIVGLVKKRPDQLVNASNDFGDLELEVATCRLLNKSEALPLSIDGDGLDINEEARLKYRFVDLRRARLQHNLRLRSRLINALRQQLLDQEFVEIETPMLTKSTKEGARDFVVPSRFQPGKFYALPQSPQQYKQLLMTAGFERYFQFARCIRDEDLRADRGFEFTQLDLEMSFVDQQAVMDLTEKMIKQACQILGAKLKDQHFPVVDYQQALAKYGADRFDLRTEAEKEQGVLAFAWVVNFPFFKKVDRSDAAEVLDSKSAYTFTHNPFSSPAPEWLEAHLAGQQTEQIIAAQYDLVCNGYEVGGGSIRAHQPEVLRATFKAMGYNDQEIEASVGHMLQAFRLGTPPHGGIALGVDRLVMLMTGETSLKEVTAFPMTSTGRTSVMDAPSSIADSQLADLKLRVTADSSTS